jgi:hypothetical protein
MIAELESDRVTKPWPSLGQAGLGDRRGSTARDPPLVSLRVLPSADLEDEAVPDAITASAAAKLGAWTRWCVSLR